MMPHRVPDPSSGDRVPNNNEPLIYDAQDKVIIALDFGTTFSGIAFSFASSEDSRVTSILDWPGTVRCYGHH